MYRRARLPVGTAIGTGIMVKKRNSRSENIETVRDSNCRRGPSNLASAGRPQAENLADIDEQLRTENEELRRQVLELQERKDGQERSIRGAEGLARLAEENPDPVLQISLRGAVRYRNPASFSLCRQWNPSDERRVPPPVYEMVKAAYGRSQVIRHEMTFGKRTYLVTVAPAPALAEYVNIYASDITARKQAETALRERIKELVCLYAVSRDIQQGLSVDELCQRAVEHLVPAMQFPDLALPVIELNGKRFASGSHTEGVAHGLHAQIRVEGEVLGHLRVYYTRENPFLIPEEQNLVNGVAEALSTWLERKRAEEELRRLNATLESRVAQRTDELKHRARQLQKLALEMSEAEDRERERLAQILHDDLQQELAAAKFHLSLVRSRGQEDASTQEVIAKVDGLLKDAIAKSRSLSHELSPAALHQDDFAQILHWLAGEMQEKQGLTVRVQGQAYAASYPIKAFLYRTAQELLFNTVKHAQVNEARVRVRQCGGYLGLTVSDGGRGFDPERLREAPGFGLLSIRERIELLGGRMKIRSAPGRGSTFLVVVPDGETTAPYDRAQNRAPSAPEHEGRLRLFLADDHQVVRQGLIALFSEEDTVEIVGEASNGREAVDLVHQLHPDVVVMDVSMPVMSGEEAARQIKQDLPQTRVVALSMREEPEMRERICQAGAESYVLKTAPFKELLAAIRGRRQAPNVTPRGSTL